MRNTAAQKLVLLKINFGWVLQRCKYIRLLMEMFSKERTRTKNPLIVCTGGSINLNFIVFDNDKKVLSENNMCFPRWKDIWLLKYTWPGVKIGPNYR